MVTDVVASLGALPGLIIPWMSVLSPITLFVIYAGGIVGGLLLLAYLAGMLAVASRSLDGDDAARTTFLVLVIIAEAANICAALLIPSYSVVRDDGLMTLWFLRAACGILAIVANIWFLMLSPAAKRYFAPPVGGEEPRQEDPA